MKLLKKRKKGPEGARLQKKLGITADGIFGPATHKAVIRFQLDKELKVDGIVGNNTWHMLTMTKPTPEAIDEDSDINSQYFKTPYDQIIHRYYLGKS